MEPWLTERLAKFQSLKDKREEAVSLNLASTKEEDAELKTNPRLQARLLRKKAKAESYLSKQAALESGVDLDRQNNLTYTMEDSDRWNDLLAKKDSRKDPGFTDFNQLSRRKYEKLTGQLDPQKTTQRTKQESLEAMSEEIKEDQNQRQKRSRRRRYDETEVITFINERNARFNRKVARAYDEYTEDLKESLERGSAV